jgi:hypothetical protein
VRSSYFDEFLVDFDAQTPIAQAGALLSPGSAFAKKLRRDELAHLGPCPAHLPPLTTELASAALEAHLSRMSGDALRSLLSSAGYRVEPSDLAAAQLSARWKRTKRWNGNGDRIVRDFRLEGIAVVDAGRPAYLTLPKVVDGQYRRTVALKDDRSVVAEVIEFDGLVDKIVFHSYPYPF